MKKKQDDFAVKALPEVVGEVIKVTPQIRLTMPVDVAITLERILANVGGKPEGYRGHSDGVLRALWNSLEKVDVPEGATDRVESGSIFLRMP